MRRVLALVVSGGGGFLLFCGGRFAGRFFFLSFFDLTPELSYAAPDSFADIADPCGAEQHDEDGEDNQ